MDSAGVYLLEKLYKLGATVPKVYDSTQESILIEFIGDELAALRFVDVELNTNHAKKGFGLILNDIKLLLECGAVRRFR